MESGLFFAAHPWVYPGLWGLFFLLVVVLCRRVQLEYTHEERHHHQGALTGLVLVGIPVTFILYVVWLLYAKTILAWLHLFLVDFGL